MFPKSLVFSVLLGVVAAGAIGVFMVEIGSQQYELEYVYGPSVSVLVDSQDYKLGQNVTITVVNSGTESILFSEDRPAIRIRALDGTLFFATTLGLDKLESHQERGFVWGQQKNDGTQVLEGRYVVEVQAHDGQMQRISDKLTINILK